MEIDDQCPVCGNVVPPLQRVEGVQIGQAAKLPASELGKCDHCGRALIRTPGYGWDVDRDRSTGG